MPKAEIKPCAIEGCEKRAASHSHRLCHRHIYLKRVYGSTEPRPKKSRADRFWELVDRSGECWLWRGAISDSGYGRFGKNEIAHRVAYELTHGECPNALQVDHICHNRACVRPNHLRLVTNKQNQENRSGLPKNNTSGVRGVCWRPKRNRYQAAFRHNGLDIWVGYFKRREDAEAAVVAKRNEMFTHNELDRVPA